MDNTTGGVRSSLLIGRDDLLELVDRRLDDVVSGRGQFLLVAGEAGIGKSRFLEALVAKAEERGFAAAGGFVAPQDQDVPAASILDMARSMLRTPAFEALGHDLLARTADTGTLGLGGRRRFVIDLVDRILTAAPDRSLFLFEDLQWADDLSLEIIAELARHARDRQVMMAGGYRTDETPIGTILRDWRSRLLTQRIAEEIRLKPLGAAETALLTTLILDTGLPAPREVAAAVYERTDGIPLHIEELLGAIGAEARANGLAIREAKVPDTIEDAVISRLGHRSADAQRVARAGAVIGRCFVPEVLAGIMDVPVESLDAPLQELIDNFVLEPPGARGLYDFRHQLLRDAIYRSVPLADLRHFHARAGEFGAQLEGQSEIHASLHYERAGMRREAFEAALTGAREASRLAAHHEAFELYRRTVDNMPADLLAIDRATILEALADEAASVEANDAAATAAKAAAEAFMEAGETLRALAARFITINIARRACRPISESLAALDEVLVELAALPDSDERRSAIAEYEWFRGIVLTDQRSLPEARAALASARAGFEALGDDEGCLAVDWKATVVDILAGGVTDGLARARAIAEQAEHDGYASTGVSAYRDSATYAVTAFAYGPATRMIDEGLRYADAIEQSQCAHVMRATSALVAWAGGEWDESNAQARQALSDPGCRRAAEAARWAIGNIALGRGRLDAAVAEFEPAFDFGLTSEAVDLIMPPLWGLAETAWLAGEPETALARCRDALDRARALGERIHVLPFVVTGVRAAQAAGRPALGATWLAECEAWLQPIAEVAAAPLDHARGLVALADGATGVARAALEAAIRAWDTTGRSWEASWARLDLAQCHIRTSRFAETLALAVEVRTLASRIDSRPLAERADQIARLARGRVPEEAPWRPLTAREFAVARLISEGRTNGEIADELGIAPKTASSHVEHILAKLGASRRAEIATWASNVERSPAAH
jgi:DNA-binding CsgD family transcriptional regulator